MLTRSRRTLGLAAVAIAVLSLGAGAQGRGNGHDKDKDKGDKGKDKDDEHRVVVVSPGNVIVRRVPGTIIDRRVPPGLAKKPGGMPPGQYKKRKQTFVPKGCRNASGSIQETVRSQ